MLNGLGIVRFLRFSQCLANSWLMVVALCYGQYAVAEEVATNQVKRKVAAIRHLSEGPRGPFVVIDGGQTKGYVIGTDVCFYDDNGNETTCSIVERSNLHAAGLLIERNRMSLIRVGDRAWFKDGGPVPPKGENDGSADADINQLAKQEEIEPPLLERRWFLNYSFAPGLPVAVNTLKFDAASRASGNGSVWAEGAVQRFSPVGFSTGVHLPRAGTTNLTVFMGYQFLPQSPVLSDYDLTDSSQTVESNVSGHFYRIGTQIGETVWHTESSDWMVGGGLDLHYITHKFSAVLTGGTALAEGSMRHFLIGAPLGTWYELHFGGWALSAGIEATIPMVLFGEKITGEVGYSENTTARKDMNSVSSAINPRKSLGVALRLGIGGKF